MGELVKLPGRESRGDAGSNPIGVSIFSRLFLSVSCLYCCTYSILVLMVEIVDKIHGMILDDRRTKVREVPVCAGEKKYPRQ